MNNFKRIALTLLLFIGILMVISLFLPSSLYIERSIVIYADKEQIFKQVNDLKNWKNWATSALKDKGAYNNEDAYSLNTYGVGATFKWESENDEVGIGRMQIIESVPNSYIKNEVNFGFMQSIFEWKFNDNNEKIEVVLTIDVDFGFNPYRKFLGLFIEDQLALDYELGLERLKIVTENLPKINSVEVKSEKMEEDLWFLSIRDTINPMEMNNVHGRIYSTIDQHLRELGIAKNTSPIVMYHSWSDTLCDIEVGIPVKDSTILGNKKIKSNSIKSTYVVTAVHHGAYDRLIETYFGINEWMRKNKVFVNGPNWELYIVDPSKEPNPKKWKTAIYFPIKKPNN